MRRAAHPRSAASEPTQTVVSATPQGNLLRVEMFPPAPAHNESPSNRSRLRARSQKLNSAPVEAFEYLSRLKGDQARSPRLDTHRRPEDLLRAAHSDVAVTTSAPSRK